MGGVDGGGLPDVYETILAPYRPADLPRLPQSLPAGGGTRWQEERRDIRAGLGLPEDAANGYSREPFAADVSVGKNDPTFGNAQFLPAPRRRTRRSCAYTDPGDIVCDGFCGMAQA